MKNKTFWLFFAAFAFAAAILFLHLGNSGMYAPQEGRTGMIVHQMLKSGDFLNMDLPECIRYEKPIGHYWIALPFGALFGLGGDPLNCAAEWALRLPSALAGMLLLVFTALLGSKIYGKTTGALSVIVLGSSMLFVHLGKLAHIDMLLACACGGAMYYLYRGYFAEKKANGYLYGFYAFLGIGVMLKGPLPVILAGLTVLAMMIRERDWMMPLKMRPWTGALLFLAVVLPWYITETVRSNGEFFMEFIWRQNIQRFTGAGSTYRNGEFMPLYYYFVKFPAGFAPWTAAGFLAMAFYWKKWIRLRFSDGSAFLFFWFTLGFLFFTFSALKRGDYLLPVYPAAAILTAAALERMLKALPGFKVRYAAAGWGVLAVLAAGFLAVNLSGLLLKALLYVRETKVIRISRTDMGNMLMMTEFILGHAALCIGGAVLLLAVLALLGWLLAKRKNIGAFGLFCAGVFVFFQIYYGVIEPRADLLKSTKPFLREFRPLIPENECVAVIGDFNVETVFFLNRSYSGRILPGTSFVIAPPEKEMDPAQWRKLGATEEGHFYPQILYQRIAK